MTGSWVCAVRKAGGVLVMAMGLSLAHAADQTGGDPLGSMQWPVLRQEFFGPAAAKVQFDARVRVLGPRFAEDPMNVPIAIDATELTAAGLQVVKMVVVVDRNPIRKVLEFVPGQVQPKLSFRFKLEQASPVRVGVLDQAGVWHIGSAQVDAAGGGCTVPGASRADGSWSKTLNLVQARYFSDVLDPSSARLRLRIMHPMDTGLVAGIPSFHVERVQLEDAEGRAWMRLLVHEPVSENPTFSLDLKGKPTIPLKLTGRDNNGNLLFAEVNP